MLTQRGQYGTGGGGFGDDGLNHVRFEEEVDVEHDSGPAVPDHAKAGGGYQGKRSKQPKQSTGGWGQMPPQEGRTERDEDYRAVPPPTQAFEGQRTAAMPEHATDISIPQSVSVGWPQLIVVQNLPMNVLLNMLRMWHFSMTLVSTLMM